MQWSNPSVLELAGSADPRDVIIERARNIILKAIDEGWQGPPFDPFWLAHQLNIQVVAKEDILDARILPNDSNELIIEYNPNQPRNRIKFSLAHEIAHTLFPDCADTVRNRLSGVSHRSDEWQLELLCNMAAAEFLMPIEYSVDLVKPTTIDNLVQPQKRFDVSMESLLLRFIKLTDEPVAVFAASRENDDSGSEYRIEYFMPSISFDSLVPTDTSIPSTSVLSECTAVGYTAKRREKWNTGLQEFYVECVGLPPYRGQIYPRVAGIVRNSESIEAQPPRLTYLIGDATEPRGGEGIIAHIVNDATPTWGGGFARRVAQKWPSVQEDFREWVNADRSNLSLGNVHFTNINERLGMANMIAQHGYGQSASPRLRYHALRDCLEKLSVTAKEKGATIHMPRIGTGNAGGDWRIISEIVHESLIMKGIDVIVYNLPGYVNKKKATLGDFLTR